MGRRAHARLPAGRGGVHRALRGADQGGPRDPGGIAGRGHGVNARAGDASAPDCRSAHSRLPNRHGESLTISSRSCSTCAAANTRGRRVRSTYRRGRDLHLGNCGSGRGRDPSLGNCGSGRGRDPSHGHREFRRGRDHGGSRCRGIDPTCQGVGPARWGSHLHRDPNRASRGCHLDRDPRLGCCGTDRGPGRPRGRASSPGVCIDQRSFSLGSWGVCPVSWDAITVPVPIARVTDSIPIPILNGTTGRRLGGIQS